MSTGEVLTLKDKKLSAVAVFVWDTRSVSRLADKDPVMWCN